MFFSVWWSVWVIVVGYMLVVNFKGFIFLLLDVCMGICSIMLCFFVWVCFVIVEVSGVCGKIVKVIFVGREKVVILVGW